MNVSAHCGCVGMATMSMLFSLSLGPNQCTMIVQCLVLGVDCPGSRFARKRQAKSSSWTVTLKDGFVWDKPSTVLSLVVVLRKGNAVRMAWLNAVCSASIMEVAVSVCG